MRKNRMRLTESQLYGVIKESVRQMLSELDWKTYANAGKKAGKGGNISTQREMNPEGTPSQWFKDALNARSRADKFYDKARKQFDTDYGYSNGSLYDKDASNVRMGGSFTSSEEFSPHAVGYQDKGYGNPYKYEYGRRYDGYAGQDMSPEEFFNGNQEAADSYHKANREMQNFKRNNYEYQKGKGWQKKDGLDESIRFGYTNLSETIKRAVRKVLNEERNGPGTLSYLAMELISNNGAMLQDLGSVNNVKRFIESKVNKLSKTSKEQKYRFLYGDGSREYGGLMGAHSMNEIYIILGQMFQGGNGLGLTRNGMAKRR